MKRLVVVWLLIVVHQLNAQKNIEWVNPKKSVQKNQR